MADLNRIPADRLLAELVERHFIELRGNADRAQLAERLSKLFEKPQDAHQRAASLAAWLMTQESVAELFASDDDLATLLAQQIH